MLRRLAVLTWIATSLFSCAEDAKDPEVVGTIRQNQVWKDGTKLGGLIQIVEGTTVEIEPGAKITCVEAVQIQVGGVLRVKSPGAHASIVCPRWRGVLVAQNGQLDIEGLDIENAEVGVETTKGAGAVNLTDSSVLTSVRPFLVRAESKLTVTRVRATTPTTLAAFENSVSEVYGSFVAKYLDYEANTNEGIMVMKDGEADIEDSTLKAKNGLDIVSSYGGKSLKLRYSTLRGGHCGPHVAASKDEEKKPTGALEIDHVTSEGNTFGITIYALAMPGPHVIKDSNFQGDNAWLDLQGDHGVIDFQNVFTEGAETILNTNPPTLAKTPTRVDAAKPR